MASGATGPRASPSRAAKTWATASSAAVTPANWATISSRGLPTIPRRFAASVGICASSALTASVCASLRVGSAARSRWLAFAPLARCWLARALMPLLLCSRFASRCSVFLSRLPVSPCAAPCPSCCCWRAPRAVVCCAGCCEPGPLLRSPRAIGLLLLMAYHACLPGRRRRPGVLGCLGRDDAPSHNISCYIVARLCGIMRESVLAIRASFGQERHDERYRYLWIRIDASG